MDIAGVYDPAINLAGDVFSIMWQRVTSLGGLQETRSDETWIYTPEGRRARQFSVRVTNGKPFNVLALKTTDLNDVRDYAAYLRNTAKKLYAPGGARHRVKNCPCCRSATANHAVEYDKFVGVTYHRCTNCGHGFVLDQPVEETLSAGFSDSADHSSTYIDRALLEARMREIIAPKLDWTISIYQDLHGKKPTTGVDVGAGGGHFVEGMRRSGLSAVGYEISQSSRQFAKDAFELELCGEDFRNSTASSFDVVTFWGLLEYTPHPRQFLEAARRHLSDRSGLIVVEVPRLDCLGTVVQAANPSGIARHMDPTSHVNTFSDASLATALVETGFRPVAAWYFGMDVYEFLIQAALRLDQTEVVDKLADMIPALQAALDQGRQCDDLVVAAVPMDE